MEVPTEVITCCNTDCGISFAVPAWWIQGKLRNHSWWYCPNGHHQHFPAESDLEKMQRERDIARQQIARVEQEKTKAEARQRLAERKLAKANRRASAGACPCCQRSFSNMARHMKTKHPDFIAESTENVVRLKAKA